MDGRKVRVALVVAGPDLGGAERSLVDLCAAIDRSRFELVAARAGPDVLGEAFATIGVPVVPFEGVTHLRRLLSASGPARALRAARGAASLARVLKRVRPDVVHANGLAAALQASLTGSSAPLVWHVRDLIDHPLLHAWLRRRATAVVAPSRACAALVGRGGGSAQVFVVPNGIPPARTEVDVLRVRRDLGVEGCRVILSVGQIVPWKRHDVALEAFRLASSRRNDLAMVLVGAEPATAATGLTRSLADQAATAGLGGRVRFLGRRDDVRGIMSAADVLLHAAYPEPFGRVIVEAMAEGLPVVCVGGPHGVTEIAGTDPPSAWLVPRLEPQALADAVLGLLDTPGLAASMRHHGRRRAADFDPAIGARAVEGIYGDVIVRRVR